MAPSSPRIGPAEALLLARPRAPHPFEYVSYTLAELIMLGVVKVETRMVQPHPNDLARTRYYFLQKGDNLDTFTPLSAHEEILGYLRKHEEVPLHLLAISLKQSYQGRSRAFMTHHLKPPLVLAGLMSKGPRFPASTFFPTTSGWRIRRRLWREMLWARHRFPKWLRRSDTLALRCFATYGPILLMMPGLPFEQLADMPTEWRDVDRLKTSLGTHAGLYNWQDLKRLPDFAQLRQLDTWVLAFENAYLPMAIDKGGEVAVAARLHSY